MGRLRSDVTPDLGLQDMDMTQFLAKAAQQAKGDGNLQGMCGNFDIVSILL